MRAFLKAIGFDFSLLSTESEVLIANFLQEIWCTYGAFFKKKKQKNTLLYYTLYTTHIHRDPKRPVTQTHSHKHRHFLTYTHSLPYHFLGVSFLLLCGPLYFFLPWYTRVVTYIFPPVTQAQSGSGFLGGHSVNLASQTYKNLQGDAYGLKKSPHFIVSITPALAVIWRNFLGWFFSLTPIENPMDIEHRFWIVSDESFLPFDQPLSTAIQQKFL